MNLRRSKRGPWLSCSKFPKCRGRKGWTTLDDKIKADLEKKLLAHEAANPATILHHLDGSPIEKDEAPKPVENQQEEYPPS